MNKHKLPDFVTFNNFNNETLDLISKTELDLDKLNSVLSFKKFQDIFDGDSNLKSFEIEVSEFEIDDDRILSLVAASPSFMDGGQSDDGSYFF